ncbi:hypothetical protein PAPYR_7088 [Paratrimastix pyriformis]|uniref:Uncharacterized protein n=1 Tax=Paratrimastix pyriformis TaxID=342808 RepID=A0ABQ8UHW2_9EUKA|nr:hypothetical protein PAPYR_7088 [Paratrimastix pyriformis]
MCLDGKFPSTQKKCLRLESCLEDEMLGLEQSVQVPCLLRNEKIQSSHLSQKFRDLFSRVRAASGSLPEMTRKQRVRKSAKRQREAADDPGSGIDSDPIMLLLALVDAAPFPLQVYCQLIGLTHGIRTAIRGAPRVLSFLWPGPLLDDPWDYECCLAPCLPADALAALVGPCKGLVRLTLPPHCPRHPSVLGCAIPRDGEPVGKTWVDEAFSGHTQLAYLEIPGAGATFWPAIWWILSHLPGLEEFHFLQARPLRTRVLQALAAFCPKLRVLHLTQHLSGWSDEQDFTVLEPIAGTIKELIVPDLSLDFARLVKGLSSLERLEVMGGDLDSLRPIAQHLTHLVTNNPLFVRGFTEAGFCRLESLTTESTSGGISFAPVMTACRDTLRSLSLSTREDIAPGQGLLAALGGLTHLTRLKLTGAWGNHLEYLSLYLAGDIEGTTYRLSSRSLREVYLCGFALPDSCTLTLACPFLEKLVPPRVKDSKPYGLIMDCPHLRSLKALPSKQNLDHSAPMPELVEVGGLYRDEHLDPAWLAQLVAWSPSRLRLLSHVAVSQAMLSQLFAGCPSLTSLRSIHLHLTATTGPPVFVLQLPEQLEILEGSVIVEGAQGPAELRMEAPGLRALHLGLPPAQLTLACPALVVVALSVFGAGRTSFVLDEGTRPPLRSLRLGLPFVAPITPAAGQDPSLLAVLTRHGSRLQCVSVSSAWLTPEAWPEVAAALGRLPRLVSLEVDGIPSADIALACPRLSHLSLIFGVELRSLVLDCPQLEELKAPFDSHLERFELVGEGEGRTAPSKLSSIEYLWDATWLEQLEKRFPDAYLQPDSRTRRKGGHRA